MRRLFALISGLTVLLLLLVGIPVLAQTTTPPQLVFHGGIPGLTLNKFPDVATFERTVHVGVNNNRTDAIYLSKADVAQTFGAAEALGSAPGKPDYSPVSIATGSDGSVHLAWINQETRQLLYRSKVANGTFGAMRTILTSGGFPANINLAVASDGAIYISWRLANLSHRVVRLANSSAAPTGPYELGTKVGTNFGYLATGPTGQVAVAYTSEGSGRLQIFAAIWNGTGFDTHQVTSANADYADPSASYGPDGTLTFAWRGLEDGTGAGIWLGTYQGNQQWVTSRVTVPSKNYDIPNVQIDAQGNTHLSWISDISGVQLLYYAYRPKGGTFSVPITAPNLNSSIFNPRMAVNIADNAYAHTFTEIFQGNTQSVHYFLFAAAVTTTASAIPVIENNAAYTIGKSAVQVAFNNVLGTPTEVRWRWGAAPTDTAADSGGWQTFANPMSMSVPASLLSSATCAPVTLYTQVRNASGGTSSAQSDQIVFDTGVTGRMIAINPYNRYRAGTFSPLDATANPTVTTGLAAADLADFGTEGASDGDPDYTRVPPVYVEVRGIRECSGLQGFSQGSNSTSLGQTMTVTNDLFTNLLPFPGTIALGSNQLLLRVTDKAGNVNDYQQTISYDPAKPILVSSTLDSLVATSPYSTATILAQLAVKNVVVSDTYALRGFWGVWVANSRTEVTNPMTDTLLRWAPIEVPGTSADFNLQWSLGAGLSASQVTTGTYFIYMRFLDGAGNATDNVISTTLAISQVTRPRTALPLIRR